MISTYFTIICVIFFVTVQHDSNAIDPVMKPMGNKLELEPGEPLEITCVSSKRIKFIQPRPKQFMEFKSSIGIERVIQNDSVGAWISTLQKPRTTIADGGFYGCTNYDVKVDVNNHNQKNVAWIEVMIPNW